MGRVQLELTNVDLQSESLCRTKKEHILLVKFLIDIHSCLKAEKLQAVDVSLLK